MITARRLVVFTILRPSCRVKAREQPLTSKKVARRVPAGRQAASALAPPAGGLRSHLDWLCRPVGSWAATQLGASVSQRFTGILGQATALTVALVLMSASQSKSS